MVGVACSPFVRTCKEIKFFGYEIKITEDKDRILIHLRSDLSMFLVWMLITFQISQQ